MYEFEFRALLMMFIAHFFSFLFKSKYIDREDQGRKNEKRGLKSHFKSSWKPKML